MDVLVVVGFLVVLVSAAYLRRDMGPPATGLLAPQDGATPLPPPVKRAVSAGPVTALYGAPPPEGQRAHSPARPGVLTAAPSPAVLPVRADAIIAMSAKVAADKILAEARAAEAVRKRQIMEAKEKLVRAQTLLEDSGLLTATLAVFEEVAQWPALIEAESFVPPATLDGLEAGREEVEGPDGRRETRTWTAWRLDGLLIRQELHDRGAPRLGISDSASGGFAMSADDTPVLTLAVSRNLGPGYSKWTADAVEALVVGPWMITIAKLAAQLRAYRNAEASNREMGFYGAKADRIDFGPQEEASPPPTGTAEVDTL